MVKKMEGTDGSDGKDPRWEDIIAEIIEEDFLVSRLTEKQEKVLSSYYVNSKTDVEIAAEENIKVDKVLEIKDTGIKEVEFFSRVCGIKDIFKEENFKEILRKGNKDIQDYLEFLKIEKGEKFVNALPWYIDIIKGHSNTRDFRDRNLNSGMSRSEFKRKQEFCQRIFYSGVTKWHESLKRSERNNLVALK